MTKHDRPLPTYLYLRRVRAVVHQTNVEDEMNVATKKYDRFRAGLLRDAKTAEAKKQTELRNALLRQASLVWVMKNERERVR